MDLVDEQDRLLTLEQASAGQFDDAPHFFHTRRQRRQRLELASGGTGDERRQRGLPGAGRAVEQHRRGAGAFDETAQRGPRCEQMLLADYLGQRRGPHPNGQRGPRMRRRRRARNRREGLGFRLGGGGLEQARIAARVRVAEEISHAPTLLADTDAPSRLHSGVGARTEGLVGRRRTQQPHPGVDARRELAAIGDPLERAIRASVRSALS